MLSSLSEPCRAANWDSPYDSNEDLTNKSAVQDFIENPVDEIEEDKE